MVNWKKVDKKNHLVLVIPRKALFGEKNERYFEGFSKINLSKEIEENSGFLTRGKPKSKESLTNDGLFAESDKNYKQLLPYLVIINKEKKKVYAYKRATKTTHVHESRLHGNWSWGVGGHLDFNEKIFEGDVGSFIKEGLMREFYEEVSLENGRLKNLQLIGFINDDSNSVGEVHLGILFFGETDSTEITPNDLESTEGKFLTFDELEEIATNPSINCDNWSRILLKPLKEFLD